MRIMVPKSSGSRTRNDIMNEQRTRAVTVGEAIVELVPGGDGRFGIGSAGDAFNVAVYLARAGLDVAFATALGDDPYSDAILALAAAEGVASDLVLRLRGGLPGLAVVDSGADGTRHHHDWRGEAPARELCELPEWGAWPRVSPRQSSSISPASHFRSIRIPASAASSRSSRWCGSRA